MIKNDLTISGAFRMVDTAGVANVPFEPTDIRDPLWQAAGAQSVAIGKVEAAGGGQLKISFRLMDAAQKKQLTGGEFTVTPDRTRQVAHAIADMIYEAITGQKGFFNTRIVYVLKTGGSYLLQVADVTAAAPRPFCAQEPIISQAGARMADASPMCRLKARNRWSGCRTWPPASVSPRPTSRAATPPQPGARTAASWRWY